MWHQLWCRVQRSNRAMASILTPQKNISPWSLYFPLSHDLPLEGDFKILFGNTHKHDPANSLLSEGFRKFSSGRLNFSAFPWSTPWGRNYFSAAPIKSAPPNHPLVKGNIETGRSQKIFPGTPIKALSNCLTSGGVPQEHPIPSPDKEVITSRQLNNRHRKRYDRAMTSKERARRRCGVAERSRGRHTKTVSGGRCSIPISN